MADFRPVAKATEIAPGEMKLVEFEGEEVVIANVDGSFFAFGNKCTHVGGPLVEGDLDDDTVTCPWHSTMFNVRSGESLGGPGENPVPTYEARVEGDDIEIGPALPQQPGEAEAEGPDSVIVADLKDFLDTQIRPTLAAEGGDVAFAGFEDGVLTLELGGSGHSTPLFALKVRIENTVRRDFPEVEEVRFVSAAREPEDTSDKPGMQTPEAEAIQKLLAEQINPAVAAHGGLISLVDVQDDTVYIRLEGGCQGCGMADVTLKQGIEEEIKRTVPQIATVLDVTDHAGGTNPYYQPGKMEL